MKPILLAICLLLGCSSANSDELNITKEEGPSSGSTKIISYRANNHLCYISFEIVYSVAPPSKSIEYVDKGERCDKKASYAYKVKIYDSIIDKIFEEGIYDNENVIKLHWGTTEDSSELVCRLVNYASSSNEWRTLLNKFGNRPVFFAEQNPFPQELGTLVMRSGLLIEIDSAFQKHGFKLKSVNVGGFSSMSVKKLEKQFDCVAPVNSAKVVPIGAELYLLFERIRPQV